MGDLKESANIGLRRLAVYTGMLFMAALMLLCVVQPRAAHAAETDKAAAFGEFAASEGLQGSGSPTYNIAGPGNPVEGLSFDTAINIGINIGGTNYASEARKVLGLINAERKSLGIPELVWDTNLERSAMLRSAEISFLFEHNRPNGTSCRTAAQGTDIDGENIAMLPSANAEFVNAMWKGSEGHHANMISKYYKSVGIACFNGYWVECFSTTAGSGMTSAPNNESGYWTIEVAPQYFGRVFEDVNPKAWYVKEGHFSFVFNNGIMSGYSDGPRFGPYDNITRGQVAVILHRVHLGQAARDASNDVPSRFYDVPSGQYYSAAVKWASDNGIVTGYKQTGSFGPDDPVTREQLATMIARYAEKFGGQDVPSASKAKFDKLEGSSEVSPWAKQSLVWCVDNGIITGVDNKHLKPQDPAWRASMAKIITVTLTKVM